MVNMMEKEFNILKMEINMLESSQKIKNKDLGNFIGIQSLGVETFMKEIGVIIKEMAWGPIIKAELI